MLFAGVPSTSAPLGVPPQGARKNEVSLQELAAVTQERQIACGLPIGDLRGFGRVRADASLVQLALDRGQGLLRPGDAERPLLAVALDGEPAWVSTYVPGTNVVESTARTASGELCVVDFMALAEGRPGQAEAVPAGRFVRLVTCTEGEVAFELVCAVGEGLADESVPTQGGAGAARGWHFASSRAVSFGVDEARVSVTLSAGESVAFVISEDEVEGGAALVASALHALGDTIHYWTWWSDRCRYKGDDFEAVLREALGLKLACSATGLQVESPGVSGFAPAPLGDTSRAAARFLDLGYRHECAELLAVVHDQKARSLHERWASEGCFDETLERYLARYGAAGLAGPLLDGADVPPPQSRTA